MICVLMALEIMYTYIYTSNYIQIALIIELIIQNKNNENIYYN